MSLIRNGQLLAEINCRVEETVASRQMTFLASRTTEVDGVAIRYRYVINGTGIGFAPPSPGTKDAGLPDFAPGWADQPLRSGRLTMALPKYGTVIAGSRTLQLGNIAVDDPRVRDGDYFHTTAGAMRPGLVCPGDRVCLQCGSTRDDLGQVLDVSDSGIITITNSIPYSMPGWISQPGGTQVPLIYVLIYPCDCDYLPNILLAEPTWVSPETILDNSKYCSYTVRAYRRANVRGMPDYWFAMPLGELPAKLEPGYYAFLSQDEGFGEDEGSGYSGGERHYYRQNGEAAQFLLRFERPMLYSDCSSHLYSHTIPASASSVDAGCNVLAKKTASGYKPLLLSQGGIVGSGNLVAINTMAVNHESLPGLAPQWRLESDAYEITGDEPEHLFKITGESVIGGSAVRAVLRDAEGRVHYSVTEYTPIWQETGITIQQAAVLDDDSLPADYQALGLVDVFAAKGIGTFSISDVLCLHEPGTATSEAPTYVVVNTNDDEPYYRQLTLKSGVRFGAWLRLTIAGVKMNRKVGISDGSFFQSISFDREALVGRTISRLVGYTTRSYWRIWDGNATVTIHPCQRSTAETEELDDSLDNRAKPPGKEATVELQSVSELILPGNGNTGSINSSETDSSTNLAMIKLEDGDLAGTPRVRLATGRELVVDVLPAGFTTTGITAPKDPGHVGLITGIGDKGDENWLVFHAGMTGSHVWLDYSYWSAETYIDHFVLAQGSVYASEAGSGKWLRYLPASSSCEDLGVICHGETGLIVQPVPDAEGDLWSITSPSGLLARYSRTHLGHVDTAVFSQQSMSGMLAELAQSFDSIVLVNSAGRLVFEPRDLHKPIACHLDAEDILLDGFELRPKCSRQSYAIHYQNGWARAGKIGNQLSLDIPGIATLAHARLIVQRLYASTRDKELELSCVLMLDLEPGIWISIPGSLMTPGTRTRVRAQVTKASHDLLKQRSTLTLRIPREFASLEVEDE